MIGDVLKQKISLLSNSSSNACDKNAFWIVLRDIAKEEIIKHETPIDSDVIIPIYYDIICKNLDFVPEYFKKTLASNHQERFRVVIRNLFSSNAFHPDGLANQPGIYAYKEANEYKKGNRIVFQKSKGEKI